jgi:hypothetical protein
MDKEMIEELKRLNRNIEQLISELQAQPRQYYIPVQPPPYGTWYPPHEDTTVPWTPSIPIPPTIY